MIEVLISPTPVMKWTFLFRAQGTIKISEKMIAASKSNRLIGCKVYFTGFFGIEGKKK